MAILTDLRDRIANELARDDLSAQIDSAIQTALDDLSLDVFSDTEVRAVHNTQAGQPYLTIPNMGYLHGITIDEHTPLVSRWSWFELQDNLLSNTTHRGQPHSFALFGCALGLYPTPDRAYPITVHYNAAISFRDEQASALLDLVRYRAIVEISTFSTQDFELAAQAAQHVARLTERLHGRTGRLRATKRIRPRRF
jgi:hypothetical protein